MWDACLVKLQTLTKVPKEQIPRHWPLSEPDLDRLAAPFGWTKLSCHPAMMTGYYNTNVCLNAYLSAGTIEVLVDRRGSSGGSRRNRLFRRKVGADELPDLFENPHQERNNEAGDQEELGVTEEHKMAGEQQEATCA